MDLVVVQVLIYFMPNVTKVKWLGQAFYQRLGKATKCLKTSHEKLNKLKEKSANKKTINAQEQIVEQDEAALYKTEQGQQAYRESQQAVSESVHAFDLEGVKQTSVQVENKLHEQAQRFDEIARTYSISVSHGKLTKFKKQIKDIACTVDFWWPRAIESLVGYGLFTLNKIGCCAVCYPLFTGISRCRKRIIPS